MTGTRRVQTVIEPQSVLEGAGVRLRRSIGTRAVNYLDPFLLLDDFGSRDRRDYEAGFPLHPHRGIETVTYMLSGAVHHKDTLGNAGSIGAGDIQWMTSGRGILHEEMPQVRPEGIAGFQLWVNLPAQAKMTEPRYQDVRAERIPEIKGRDGARIRVIAGTVDEVRGAVTDIAADPVYLDVLVPPRSAYRGRIESGHTAFAYLFEGSAKFPGPGRDEITIPHPRLVVLGDGDEVRVTTGDAAARFLLVSGKPLHEPIARYGPFVMNTSAEIEQALEDLRRGTFVR
ncbi:MAG TPA: pirin family protein [Candidatus Polarisedimenticolia bacterium]|nr:pirin family protein [Candidatus Polarisedimenticolia bacterium]